MTDPSPLLTTSPDALTLLFDADPTTLTDADLDALILELRRRRSVFASDEAAKAAAGRKARVKPTAASVAAPQTLDRPVTELSLEDL